MNHGAKTRAELMADRPGDNKLERPGRRAGRLERAERLKRLEQRLLIDRRSANERREGLNEALGRLRINDLRKGAARDHKLAARGQVQLNAQRGLARALSHHAQPATFVRAGPRPRPRRRSEAPRSG